MRVAAGLIAATLAATACAQSELGPSTAPSSGSDSAQLVGANGYVFPPPPAVTEGDLDAVTAAALDLLLANLEPGLDQEALDTVVASGDARLGWVIADLLRFIQIGNDGLALVDAWENLTGVEVQADPARYHPWQFVTDHLIAWDLPAPPGYQEMKEALFLQVEPAWAPFFADDEAAVDWRLVSWGGVFIDDRPEGDKGFCERGCIPALDDPVLTPASEGGWYSDSNIVFGVAVNAEAVAFPKNMMEIHEMVNITIGGRRLGIPYCTLCGSAQAYFLDQNEMWTEAMVLRTSGLLTRSNKMMFELGTFSLVDTFTGAAMSGQLRQAGLTLKQTTVVASRWGDWKTAHPETRIVAQDGGLGRFYPDDPLEGRDAAGPIFPVGDVDPRLPAQALVVGVTNTEGIPVAFPADAARAAIDAGQPVDLAGVSLSRDGSGFRAQSDQGEDLVAHQAFWFAWSQFHPDTLLWQ